MIDIALLGPTVVRVDSPSAHDLRLAAKPRQILEMLALDVGLPVTKDQLAEGLWDGAPPATYVATLESYVCVLRGRLGAHRGRSGALATTPNGYVLDPEQVTVDVTRSRSMLRDSLTVGGAAGVALAMQLLAEPYGRLLMSEPYAGWAERARHELAELARDCFSEAARTADQMRDPVLAARLAGAAVRHGDVREAVWVQLVDGLWQSGRATDALRAYADLRRLLGDELGVEPGPVARELYLRILHDQPAGARGASDRHEVHTLLRLLKQSIRSLPRLDLVRDEPELAAVAAALAGRTA